MIDRLVVGCAVLMWLFSPQTELSLSISFDRKVVETKECANFNYLAPVASISFTTSYRRRKSTLIGPVLCSIPFLGLYFPPWALTIRVCPKPGRRPHLRKWQHGKTGPAANQTNGIHNWKGKSDHISHAIERRRQILTDHHPPGGFKLFHFTPQLQRQFLHRSGAQPQTGACVLFIDFQRASSYALPQEEVDLFVHKTQRSSNALWREIFSYSFVELSVARWMDGWMDGWLNVCWYIFLWVAPSRLSKTVLRY